MISPHNSRPSPGLPARKLYPKLTPIHLHSSCSPLPLSEELVLASTPYKMLAQELRRAVRKHKNDKRPVLGALTALKEEEESLLEEKAKLEALRERYEQRLEMLLMRRNVLTLQRELRVREGEEGTNSESMNYLRQLQYAQLLNVDEMSYEDLLRLGDRLGKVEVGLGEAAIAGLAREQFGGQDELCTICREGYQPGEECVRLPCGHLFHSECIANWLAKSKKCVLCLKEVNQSQ